MAKMQVCAGLATGLLCGVTASASAVSVGIVDDSRQVAANLAFNGDLRSDTGQDTDGDRFADLAEVLAQDEARSRATQLSGYKAMDDDHYAIRSRNRVGFETLVGFGEADTAEGDAMSAFRVTFTIAEPLAYNLVVNGAAPSDAGGSVAGEYLVRLEGDGVDIEYTQAVTTRAAAADTGILQPGEYLFTVVASVTGNGVARVPVDVDGQLFLTALEDNGNGGNGGGGNAIPTPAAGLAGGALMLALAARRRRD